MFQVVRIVAKFIAYGIRRLPSARFVGRIKIDRGPRGCELGILVTFVIS